MNIAGRELFHVASKCMPGVAWMYLFKSFHLPTLFGEFKFVGNLLKAGHDQLNSAGYCVSGSFWVLDFLRAQTVHFLIHRDCRMKAINITI